MIPTHNDTQINDIVTGHYAKISDKLYQRQYQDADTIVEFAYDNTWMFNIYDEPSKKLIYKLTSKCDDKTPIACDNKNTWTLLNNSDDIINSSIEISILNSTKLDESFDFSLKQQPSSTSTQQQQQQQLQQQQQQPLLSTSTQQQQEPSSTITVNVVNVTQPKDCILKINGNDFNIKKVINGDYTYNNTNNTYKKDINSECMCYVKLQKINIDSPWVFYIYANDNTNNIYTLEQDIGQDKDKKTCIDDKFIECAKTDWFLYKNKRRNVECYRITLDIKDSSGRQLPLQQNPEEEKKQGQGQQPQQLQPSSTSQQLQPSSTSQQQQQQPQQQQDKTCPGWGIAPPICYDTDSKRKRTNLLIHPDHNRGCDVMAKNFFQFTKSIEACKGKSNQPPNNLPNKVHLEVRSANNIPLGYDFTIMSIGDVYNRVVDDSKGNKYQFTKREENGAIIEAYLVLVYNENWVINIRVKKGTEDYMYYQLIKVVPCIEPNPINCSGGKWKLWDKDNSIDNDIIINISDPSLQPSPPPSPQPSLQPSLQPSPSPQQQQQQQQQLQPNSSSLVVQNKQSKSPAPEIKLSPNITISPNLNIPKIPRQLLNPQQQQLQPSNPPNLLKPLNNLLNEVRVEVQSNINIPLDYDFTIMSIANVYKKVVQDNGDNIYEFTKREDNGAIIEASLIKFRDTWIIRINVKKNAAYKLYFLRKNEPCIEPNPINCSGSWTLYSSDTNNIINNNINITISNPDEQVKEPNPPTPTPTTTPTPTPTPTPYVPPLVPPPEPSVPPYVPPEPSVPPYVPPEPSAPPLVPDNPPTKINQTCYFYFVYKIAQEIFDKWVKDPSNLTDIMATTFKQYHTGKDRYIFECPDTTKITDDYGITIDGKKIIINNEELFKKSVKQQLDILIAEYKKEQAPVVPPVAPVAPVLAPVEKQLYLYYPEKTIRGKDIFGIYNKTDTYYKRDNSKIYIDKTGKGDVSIFDNKTLDPNGKLALYACSNFETLIKCSGIWNVYTTPNTPIKQYIQFILLPKKIYVSNSNKEDKSNQNEALYGEYTLNNEGYTKKTGITLKFDPIRGWGFYFNGMLLFNNCNTTVRPNLISSTEIKTMVDPTTCKKEWTSVAGGKKYCIKISDNQIPDMTDMKDITENNIVINYVISKLDIDGKYDLIKRHKGQDKVYKKYNSTIFLVYSYTDKKWEFIRNFLSSTPEVLGSTEKCSMLAQCSDPLKNYKKWKFSNIQTPINLSIITDTDYKTLNDFFKSHDKIYFSSTDITFTHVESNDNHIGFKNLVGSNLRGWDTREFTYQPDKLYYLCSYTDDKGKKYLVYLLYYFTEKKWVIINDVGQEIAENKCNNTISTCKDWFDISKISNTNWFSLGVEKNGRINIKLTYEQPTNPLTDKEKELGRKEEEKIAEQGEIKEPELPNSIIINFASNDLINGTYKFTSKGQYLNSVKKTSLSFDGKKKWTITNAGKEIATKECTFKMYGCSNIISNYKDWTISGTQSINLDLSILTPKKYNEINTFFNGHQTIYLHDWCNLVSQTMGDDKKNPLQFKYNNNLFYYKGDTIKDINLYYYATEKEWQICDDRNGGHKIIATHRCPNKIEAVNLGYGDCSPDIRDTNHKPWKLKEPPTKCEFDFNYDTTPTLKTPQPARAPAAPAQPAAAQPAPAQPAPAPAGQPETIVPQKQPDDFDQLFKTNNVIMISTKSRPDNLFDGKNTNLPAYFVFNPVNGLYEGKTETDKIYCSNDDSSKPPLYKNTADFSMYSLYYIDNLKEWNILKFNKANSPYTILARNKCHTLSTGTGEGKCSNGNITKTNEKWKVLQSSSYIKLYFKYSCGEGFVDTRPKQSRGLRNILGRSPQQQGQAPSSAAPSSAAPSSAAPSSAAPAAPSASSQNNIPIAVHAQVVNHHSISNGLSPPLPPGALSEKIKKEVINCIKGLPTNIPFEQYAPLAYRTLDECKINYTGGSRKKIKNKPKSYKKKYNVKYMSKRHIKRSRHSKRRHKQRGGLFDAAQYVGGLFGNNITAQEAHLVNGALQPTPSGIVDAETYQGGSKRRRGGSLGFVGANVAPATLFATNLFYGKNKKSRNNKKTKRRKTYRRHR